MLILPAIDLKQGRCVRLVQGRMKDETVYSDDPAAVARQFVADGARMLHLVDLDGAFHGESENLAAVRAIRAAVDVPLELGGGLRSLNEIAAVLALGIDSAIVGTLAVRNPILLEQALARYGGERVQLAIDAREGRVAVDGWAEDTVLEAVAFAVTWRERGIERVIFTDIARDGMLAGPNTEAIGAFARGAGVRVTASGGVTRAEDVRALAELEPAGVDRVIIGKALYEGALSLAELANLNA
jgi:phosphoribosylformimino-5-aminoimidazole carboxamide ribotide isomerase